VLQITELLHVKLHRLLLLKFGRKKYSFRHLPFRAQSNTNKNEEFHESGNRHSKAKRHSSSWNHGRVRLIVGGQ